MAHERSLEELVPAFLLATGPLSPEDLEALKCLPRDPRASWRERAAPFLAGLIRSLNDVLATHVLDDQPLATYLAVRRLSPLFSELVEFTIAEHVARRDEGGGEDEASLGVAVVESSVPGAPSGRIRVQDA